VKRFLFILSIAALAFTLTACNEKDLSAASKAAAGVSAGLAAVEGENELLYNSGKIDKDETIVIAQAVRAGTYANDAFAGCVRGIHANGNEAGRQVYVCFSTLSDRLSQIQANDLHVKDPQAQQNLQLAWQSVNTALKAVEAFIPKQ
jgi:predicted small secreted protein